MKLKFRNGYKSQLVDTVSFQLPPELFPLNMADTEFIRLDAAGMLTIRMGYAWDRASGPTSDRPYHHTVFPSLIHDALCQLHRQGYLNTVNYPRMKADKLFYKLLLSAGMNKVRAWVWYRGVRWGAKLSKQKPKNVHEIEVLT